MKIIKMCFIVSEQGRELVPLEFLESVYSPEVFQRIANLTLNQPLKIEEAHLPKHTIASIEEGVEITDSRMNEPERVYLDFNRYKNNGNICIDLVTINSNEPWLTVTTNLKTIPDENVKIKDYSENEGILEILNKENILTLGVDGTCNLSDKVLSIAQRHLTLKNQIR